MLHVYCDTGAYVASLAPLEASGKIALYQFMYENRTRRIRRGAIPSNIAYDDLKHYKYDEFGTVDVLKDLTYDQLGGVNSRFSEIQAVVGTSNRRDAQHIDSAWMTGCTIFLTSDKGDIWTKRSAIHELLGLYVFLIPAELEQFLVTVEGAA